MESVGYHSYGRLRDGTTLHLVDVRKKKGLGITGLKMVLLRARI